MGNIYNIIQYKWIIYIGKDFRGDVPRASAETFYRHVKFWGGKQQDAPPIFFIDGVTFMYLKANGLHFVGTTRAFHTIPIYPKPTKKTSHWKTQRQTTACVH